MEDQVETYLVVMVVEDQLDLVVMVDQEVVEELVQEVLEQDLQAEQETHLQSVHHKEIMVARVQLEMLHLMELVQAVEELLLQVKVEDLVQEQVELEQLQLF